MIEVSAVAGAHELESWAELKSRIAPDEPVTAQQLADTGEPGRILLLARRDAQPAGCGIASPSSFPDRTFMMARVLPEHRRRGVGAALADVLAAHARALGRGGVNAFVDAGDVASRAFAEARGLAEVDFQLEQVRAVGDEPPPGGVDGVEVVALAERREELLRAAWPVAQEGYADMPLPESVTYELDTWLRDEATRADGSFAALESGAVVGYAGLLSHANGDATAEHGLTVVRRDRRRRGIAEVLKRTQLHWAAQAGVVELVTWTQKGNEAMQALNARLGYETRSKVLTMQGPLW